MVKKPEEHKVVAKFSLGSYKSENSFSDIEHLMEGGMNLRLGKVTVPNGFPVMRRAGRTICPLKIWLSEVTKLWHICEGNYPNIGKRASLEVPLYKPSWPIEPEGGPLFERPSKVVAKIVVTPENEKGIVRDYDKGGVINPLKVTLELHERIGDHKKFEERMKKLIKVYPHIKEIKKIPITTE